MTFKSFLLLSIFVSSISHAKVTTQLEKVTSMNNQTQEKKGYAVCKDKSGEFFQIKLSTVEYIIILLSGNKKSCIYKNSNS